MFVTKTYDFSASHRLHSPHFGDEENARVYGKCNRPNGHGHNYGLEVTVRGPVDPRTGVVIDLGLLDRAVNEEVIERYDHRHLNLDVPDFAKTTPMVSLPLAGTSATSERTTLPLARTTRTSSPPPTMSVPARSPRSVFSLATLMPRPLRPCLR